MSKLKTLDGKFCATCTVTGCGCPPYNYNFKKRFLRDINQKKQF